MPAGDLRQCWSHQWVILAVVISSLMFWFFHLKRIWSEFFWDANHEFSSSKSNIIRIKNRKINLHVWSLKICFSTFGMNKVRISNYGVKFVINIPELTMRLTSSLMRSRSLWPGSDRRVVVASTISLQCPVESVWPTQLYWLPVRHIVCSPRKFCSTLSKNWPKLRTMCTLGKSGSSAMACRRLNQGHFWVWRKERNV